MNILWITSLVFLWVSFAAAEDTVTVSIDLTQASESQLANISLQLYTGSTVNESTSVLIADAVDLLDLINFSRPTVFYIFGWTETPQSTSVETVVGAYLTRGDHNVILVNWQEIAAELYPFAALSVPDVGSTLAKSLNELVAAGLNSTTIHIVGHSLGAQIAGAIGKAVNFTLPRITGLDPAGPGFELVISSLISTDAKFVDVIHTDKGVYGTLEGDGTVDFYPNFGIRYQPGCLLAQLSGSDDDFCSHHRSWYYYAESVLNSTAFTGVKCDSSILFAFGLCRTKTQVVMGFGTPITATGNVYLTTNTKSPFSKGTNGISP